jgi:23S rRNA (guanine745-N1)-methyltransferase
VSVLSCSVRGCGRPLERGDRVLTCADGHTYDIARSGYINLLQPQDRRSANAGDSKDAVEARARLLDAGAGRASLDSLVARAAALDLGAGACVVDLGCGSGDALAMLQALTPVTGIGIDLSTAAIDLAARRHPAVTWVVANADRRIPILDRQAALVMSLNGRRNPDEVARILSPAGRLLVAIPAPDDLIELRERIQGQAIERSRAEALLEEHEARFELVERTALRERAWLEPAQLVDVLHGTYRGKRASAAAQIEALAGMDVTLAMEIFLFSPR